MKALIFSVVVMVGVVCTLVFAAGALVESAPAVVTGQVVTSEITRLLRLERLEAESGEPWRRDDLEEFVAGLDNDGWYLVSLAVVEDHTGHAIAVEYGPLEERRHACVAAGEDGQPVGDLHRCGAPAPRTPGGDEGGAGG